MGLELTFYFKNSFSSVEYLEGVELCGSRVSQFRGKKFAVFLMVNERNFVRIKFLDEKYTNFTDVSKLLA